MKKFACEMCNSTDLVRQDGLVVCQYCGMKYDPEDVKKMMIEGSVDVSGSTVKVDNSAFVEKYLANARRAKQKEDWEETEKYYNMVEQNAPQNIEAVFYSAYGKARVSLQMTDVNKREAAFKVLGNSISVIDDYFDSNKIDSEVALVKQMSTDLKAMFASDFTKAVVGNGQNGDIRESGNGARTLPLFQNVNNKFVESLGNIIKSYPDTADELSSYLSYHRVIVFDAGGCYVATAVYGSYDCPQVWTLRRFRDYTLAESWYGRAFIKTYYAISPTLVKWFGHTNWFKNMWRGTLDHMVRDLNAEGVENTPYHDRVW